jgi:hypothetical protein
MDKHVSIDTKPRNTVTIEVAGQSFTISRVVLGARKLYGDLIREVGEQLQAIAGFDERLRKASEVSKEEWAKVYKEMQGHLERTQKFSETKMDQYFKVIELILKPNGYDFDREWWEFNCDEQDYQYFIAECLNKDVSEADKKKAMESLTTIGSRSTSDKNGDT